MFVYLCVTFWAVRNRSVDQCTVNLVFTYSIKTLF